LADYTDILYTVEGPLGIITLNRPQYRNAQSHHLLDEIDAAFDQATADPSVSVIIVRGSGGNFSSGHDLGTPEAEEYRRIANIPEGIARYDDFKKYNVDLLLKWRNCPKPTIAMVEGYCIYAGWMLAACMDLVFASADARFLAGFVEYMSIPWDVGVKKAKELCFESRFITAEEAREFGFVNRVYPQDQLEHETYAYAIRVSENTPVMLRFSKIAMNKAQDLQGYTNHLEDEIGDYVAMQSYRGAGRAEGGERRLASVDLAVRGLKGQRYGLDPQ